MARLYKSFLEFYGRLAIADNINSRSYYVLFFFAVMIFITTAIYSVGYHQADEHYQIIEFARYKLSKSKLSDLAWEFKYQIRPGFQVFVCYLVLSICDSLGLDNPYQIALFLRCLMGVFSVVVIKNFISSTIDQIESSSRNLYVFFSYFLWFIPYVSVRFSSETFSGILFLLGLSLLVQSKNRPTLHRIIYIGLLLGLSILARYQSVIMVLSLIIWMVVTPFFKKSKLIYLLGSILAIVILGFLFDKWLYGEWVFSSWNYFNVNIQRGFASYFGISPWYEYFNYTIMKPFFMLGIVILLAYLILLYREPMNLVVWVTLPFLFVHSLIPHKEPRFIFPIVFFAPYILIKGFDIISDYKPGKKVTRFILAPFILINFLILVIVVSKPAGNAEIAVTKYIRNECEGRVNIIVTPGANPYNPWKSVYSNYYADQRVSLTYISSIWDPQLLRLKKNGQTNLLIIKSAELTGDKSLAHLRKNKLKEVTFSISASILSKLKVINPDFNENSLLIFRYMN